MRNTVRAALASAAFLMIAAWARPAAADVTIQGTVGEIGGINGNIPSIANGYSGFIRFKLTDPNQTKACTGGPNSQGGSGYAFILMGQAINSQPVLAREWYAMLLVSKKGSPISCTINDGTVCQITSCTLP